MIPLFYHKFSKMLNSTSNISVKMLISLSVGCHYLLMHIVVFYILTECS
jgi:hypothetical protein